MWHEHEIGERRVESRHTTITFGIIRRADGADGSQNCGKDKNIDGIMASSKGQTNVVIDRKRRHLSTTMASVMTSLKR